MTVDVWARIEQLAKHIERKIAATGELVKDHAAEYDWYNSIYTSPRYRRAHIEIVDNRETHKLYILHCTVFPHYNDPSPIWGFDAVCGPSKITGAFHDFSMPGFAEHPMSQWWEKTSAEYQWHKPRTLPDWAQAIFSKSMVAAGNVNTEEELEALCTLAERALDCYLFSVGVTQQDAADYHQLQNRYCHYQKQNPHVIKSMVAMGVPEAVMTRFVHTVLFPEVA
jgi:hypothetical protein